jgi:uncharacterized protein (DUF3084 family)
MEKLTIAILLFFNSIGNQLDPKLTNERETINQIESQIKSLDRKRELIEVTDEDYASRSLRTNKLSDDITKLKEKIHKIEKVAILKEKWAKEDSINLLNKPNK